MGISTEKLRKGEVIFQLKMTSGQVILRGIDWAYVTTTYCRTSDMTWLQQFVQASYRVKKLTTTN